MLFLEIDIMDTPKHGEEDKIAKKQSSVTYLTRLFESYQLATSQLAFCYLPTIKLPTRDIGSSVPSLLHNPGFHNEQLVGYKRAVRFCR